MKLGVSHQAPEDLNNRRFDFLLGLGVEAIEVRLLSHEATREKLEDITSTVDSSGLGLHEIMLNDLTTRPLQHCHSRRRKATSNG